jgi:WD40 repeat protein
MSSSQGRLPGCLREPWGLGVGPGGTGRWAPLFCPWLQHSDLGYPPPPEQACLSIFQVDQSWATALAVHGDGLLASSSDDQTIRLWAPTTPTGTFELLFVADAAITALAWLPSHQLLMAGDANGRLHWLALLPAPR